MSKRNYHSNAYKKWRLKVYKRDNFQCCWPNCQSKKGLNAHHILNWSKNKVLRFSVNNGITLCEKHHKVVTGHEDNYVNFLSTLVSNKSRDQENF